ncbi:MAG: single-stranded-DNA-specific exonuclease RecJ [Aestuariivita sp.]|nr:single-stranded-DNA-specific exonuclease RecJ [Aestuariivita sp.]
MNNMHENSFLGVESSLTGRRWIGPDVNIERNAEEIAQKCEIEWPLARVLARQGVPPVLIDSYLNPTLRELLPDPRTLKDMQVAATRFLKAVRTQQPIAIFADYDVDGGASAALFIWWLRKLNIDPTLYVPDRVNEGYGPNSTAMKKLDQNHDLIICVDCGIMSHDAIRAVKKADVIVLDHHQGIEVLPPAFAVVNPNRYDEPGELGHLCAATVVFLFLVEVGRQLRTKNQASPNLLEFLDLVALATVADVAPLVGINRALVRQGLKIIAKRDRPGLKALADVTKINSTPTVGHLGFTFGPCINAGGRVGQSDLGARLLSTTDSNEAEALATRLSELNLRRREIEKKITADALNQAEKNGLDGPLVWAAGEGWHPGVVGIVASRLKEITNRPAIVISLNGKTGKGSGRSIFNIDLGAAIRRLFQEEYIIKGGGHKMAVGLTITPDKVQPAMTRLSEILSKHHTKMTDQKLLTLDGLLMTKAATPDLIYRLEKAGPFGSSAPAPRFVLPDITIKFAKWVGESHLQLALCDNQGDKIDAIAFNACDSILGSQLSQTTGTNFHLAGRPVINHWYGRQRVQLQIHDAAIVTN